MASKRARRVNARGRVTIPAAMRKQAGLAPGAEVEVTLDGDVVRLVRAGQLEAERRAALKEALAALPGARRD